MQVNATAEVVVTGRNVDVSDHYQGYVAEKLARLGRYGSHVVRYDVVLDHENNPRQSKLSQRVEITGRGKGPTVRGEAYGPDFHSAFDAAVGKLEERLRRGHDRRRVHHGRHQPVSVAAATADLATPPPASPGDPSASPLGGPVNPDTPTAADQGVAQLHSD